MKTAASVSKITHIDIIGGGREVVKGVPQRSHPIFDASHVLKDLAIIVFPDKGTGESDSQGSKENQRSRQPDHDELY